MYLIDYLTCGRCQAEFPLGSIVAFMEHKKSDCRVFLAYQQSSTEKITELYSCYNCPKKFNAAVSLLQHAQYQHSQKIFKELTNQQAEQASPSSGTQEIDTSNNSTAGRSRGGNTADFSTSSEPLEKCCAAIVPKKRKRHIETKHKNWSKTYLKYHQSNDILIDLESNVVESDSFQDNGSENGAILLQPGNMYEFGLSNRPSNKIVGISYMNSSEAVNAEPISLPQYQCLSFGLQKKDKDDTSQVKVISPQENDKSLAKRSSTSKPFKCDTCGHTFNQRIHLKKHLSKHTGVKPYKCEQCDYSTVERSHLKVHIRIHTGEKPFKCNHCEYATAQNSTLKIHLKRHHGSLFLECTHCGKSFPEKTELYEHRKEHEDVQNQSCVETKPIVPDS